MSRSRVSTFFSVFGAALLVTACRSRTDASPVGGGTVAAGGASPATVAAGNEQYFPLQSYRVGPYAAGGSGFFGGFIDYMQLVNIRDGGVNGVKLTWSECETEYVV